MLISSIKQPEKPTQKIQKSMPTFARKKYKKYLKHHRWYLPLNSKDSNPFNLRPLNDFKSQEKYNDYLIKRNYIIDILSVASKKNFSKLNLKKVEVAPAEDALIDTKNILRKKKFGEMCRIIKEEKTVRKFENFKFLSCDQGIYNSLFS